MKIGELKEKLWKEGGHAEEHPKDWIVIPVLTVIEMLDELETSHNKEDKG